MAKLGKLIHIAIVIILGIVQKIGRFFFALYNHKWARIRVPPVDDHLLLIPAGEIAQKIRKRKLRSEDVVHAYVNRLKTVNPLINAICFDRFETAILEARKIDEMLDQEDPPVDGWPPLLGVPVTVKEAFGFAGFQQTGGLKSRIGRIANKDCPAIEKLKKAGAIILCTTNVSELCMWWESNNNVYGITRNPYNLAAIVGGSSGGEGAVVSAAGSLFGLGSDIGGSIRMPAFFCGVFGHKPTTGVMESAGQFPECDSPNEWYMISSGPICRYASDLPLFMSILLKPSLDAELRLFEDVDLSKLKFYSLEEWDAKAHLVDAVDDELVTAQKKVVRTWKDKFGSDVQSLRLPDFFYIFPMWAGMMSEKGQSSQTFTQLMAGGGVGGSSDRDLNAFKEFAKWMTRSSDHTLPAILLGMTETLTHLQHAQNLRQAAHCRRLKDKISEILSDDGVMFVPIHAKAGYYHHETLLHIGNFSYTGIWNGLGFPATAVPLGLSKHGLPLGIQVVSNFKNDRYCLAVARQLELLFGGWVRP